MKKFYFTLSLLFVFLSNLFPQGFNISSGEAQTFYFKDPKNRNQATFKSETFYESISGLSNALWGYTYFNPKDIKNTIKGEISISAFSIKTGINLRDERMKDEGWLNAKKYPSITYKIKEVQKITAIDDMTIKLVTLGEFSLHGKTNLVYATITMKYIPESELSKSRLPGNLLNIKADLTINLSDYGIMNSLIGRRVGEEVRISAAIVGSTVEYK